MRSFLRCDPSVTLLASHLVKQRHAIAIPCRMLCSMVKTSLSSVVLAGDVVARMFHRRASVKMRATAPITCVGLCMQLLYETFLRDFFAADELDDELFLTEMRDGGFLGDGSEEF